MRHLGSDFKKKTKEHTEVSIKRSTDAETNFIVGKQIHLLKPITLMKQQRAMIQHRTVHSFSSNKKRKYAEIGELESAGKKMLRKSAAYESSGSVLDFNKHLQK